jgi:hypothetical protein
MTPEITGRARILLVSAENRKGRFRQVRKPAPSLNIKTIWRVYSMSSQGRHKNIGLANQDCLLVKKSFLHRTRNISLAVQDFLLVKKSFPHRIKNIRLTRRDCLLAKMSTLREVMRAA